MDGEFADIREELYKRFRQSLKAPVSERFFDEVELVEIFDFAGDLADNYARFEILMCGARLYPDSEALAERRAIFYSEVSADALTPYISDNIERHSVIWEITRLRNDKPSAKKAVEALDYVMSQYTSFSEEEAIQFVKLCCELQQYLWLKQNIGSLRTKVSYLPSLLYEIVSEAEKVEDNETEIALLNELLEDEPFSSIYWILHLRASARLAREEDAKTAFVYAKALAVDDITAMTYLLDSVYRYAPYLYDDAIVVLKDLMSKYPDEFQYVDCVCGMYVNAGSSQEAANLICKYLDRHPENGLALKQLFSCGYGYSKIGKRIKNFYDATNGQGYTPEGMAAAIDVLEQAGWLWGMYYLLSTAYEYDRLFDDTNIFKLAELMFQLRKYDACYSLLNRELDPISAWLPSLFQESTEMILPVIVYVLTCIKLGYIGEAKEIAKTLEPICDRLIQNIPIYGGTMILGIKTIMNAINAHNIKDKEFWNSYNPFLPE